MLTDFYINLRPFLAKLPLCDVSANLLVGGAGRDADSRGGLENGNDLTCREDACFWDGGVNV